MKKKIVIVDDHILIAKALTGIIENFKNYEVLYEAENGKALIDRFSIKNNIPNIVLLDINMPIMNGYETADWLTKNHPQIFVLALSMQDDEKSLIGMLKAGAKGYLLKNAHPAELEKALNSLVSKGHYYPEWATNKILHNIVNSKENNSSVQISEKEKTFLSYVCTELTYKEIADKMFCSPRTIEGYRDALFEKLEVKSRVGLAVFAIKNGYVTI